MQSLKALTYPVDFNPRPREEGDDSPGKRRSAACISIHALVKRATTVLAHNPQEAVISIHALVKRATERLIKTLDLSGISIHALVKRATCCRADG